MAGQGIRYEPSPREPRRPRPPLRPLEEQSEAQWVEPLGGADSVPLTSRTSTRPELAMTELSSHPPGVVVDREVESERMHQPMARRMGLWFVALSGLVLAAQWLFAAQGGWVLAPVAFLSAFGLIVGLTMVLAPGPKVSETERRLETPDRGGIWGRLDRTHKAIWIAAMLIAVPVAGVIAWTMAEYGMGID